MLCIVMTLYEFIYVVLLISVGWMGVQSHEGWWKEGTAVGTDESKEV